MKHTRDAQSAAPEQSFAADIVLPDQLSRASSALPDSERRLRVAILEDALRYYQHYYGATGSRARVLYEDAADWFASPDRSEPFSFENVCDALALDPHYVRRCLQQWRETVLTRATGAPLAIVRQLALSDRPRKGRSGRSPRRAA